MKSTYHLRPAKADNMLAIHALIREANINPLGLDWRRFIVAVNSSDQLIGCGQIKTHRDGTRELASIAVQPGWRGYGIASAIIDYLLSENPGLLYLTCREHLGQFYARFGFHPLQPAEMPVYFRRVSKLFTFLGKIGFIKEGLLVMRRLG